MPWDFSSDHLQLLVYRNTVSARLMVVMVLHLNQSPENLYIHFRESFGGYIYKRKFLGCG